MKGSSSSFSRLRGLAKNRFALSLADQLVVSGTRFIITCLIARFCGVEQLGLYALGFTILVLVDLVQQAFVSAPYTVYVQNRIGRSHVAYTGAATIQAAGIGFISTGTLLVAALVASEFGSESLARVLLVVASVILLSVLREFARRQCFARSHMSLALGMDLSASMIQLFVFLVLIRQGALDAVNAHLAVGFGALVASAIWFIVQYGAIGQHPALGIKRKHLMVSIVRHWHFGRWVFVTQTVNQLSWNIVQWMIAIYLSTQAVGVFAGCLTIVFLSNPIILGIANALYPRLAGIERTSQAAMRKLALRASVVISAIMLPFTIVLALAGERICELLYADPSYEDATGVLVLLALSVTCLAVTMPLDGCLWAIRRTDLSAYAGTVGMLTTLFTVLILISYGIFWATAGLLVGCAMESLLRAWLYWRSNTECSRTVRVAVAS